MTSTHAMILQFAVDEGDKEKMEKYKNTVSSKIAVICYRDILLVTLQIG